MKRWKQRLLSAAFVLLGGVVLGTPLTALAGRVSDNPYVRYTEDGYAWTIAEPLPYTQHSSLYHYPDNIPEYWYYGPNGEKNMVVDTGIESSIRELEEGEHYYKKNVYGEVPVGFWRVEHAPGWCIHGKAEDEWHGEVETEAGRCFNAYYSGWMAYCADCNEQLSPYLTYLSIDAVRSITLLDTNLGYYYRCPTCNHIENVDRIMRLK